MQYRYIIPIGEECYTSGSIDAKFNSVSMRKCAFPFDYVGHVFIEKITLKCKELLTGYDSLPTNLEIKQFGDKYFFSDSKYGFHYWHDTTYPQAELFTIEEKTIFLDKYSRRYERFIGAICTDEPVLFISVNHFDNIYKEVFKKAALLELYELLYSYNPHIKFLAVNYDSANFTHKTLEHVILPCDKTLVFEESKVKFTESLNKFMKGKQNLNI